MSVMGIKVYMDDVRPCPDGWVLARTVEECKVLLTTMDVDAISLDHDMGACEACVEAGTHIGDMQTAETTFYNYCPHAQTGMDMVDWMIEHGRVPPTVYVHSMNPVGSRRMRMALARTQKEK